MTINAGAMIGGKFVLPNNLTSESSLPLQPNDLTCDIILQ